MPLNVALFEPEIPWNTGNIGRTCVAAGASLHLIGKLGFTLSERRIKRAGMDYWPKLKLHQHSDFVAFENFIPHGSSLIFFSAEAKQSFWDAPFMPDSYLIFGKESEGLPKSLLNRHKDRIYRIPMEDGTRSLNLSTSAAVALYEALRRTGLGAGAEGNTPATT